jgi:hypothetical protein
MLNANNRVNAIDGRVIIIAFLLFYFGLILFYSCFIGDYTEFWYYKLGVPAMHPIFVDLDVVSSGCETFRLGVDPLIQNPFDEYKRPMNYPRIWLLLSYIGFGKAHTFWTGIAFGLLFFTVCLSYIGFVSRSDYQKIGLYSFVFCSPVVMLLVERGNIDIVIFALVALGIKFRNQLLAFLSVIFFASILKLYPLCLFVLGWRKASKERMWTLVFGICFVLYICFTLSDLSIIFKLNPYVIGYSFGKNIVFMFASKMLIFPAHIQKLLIDFFPNATVFFTLCMGAITAYKTSLPIVDENEKLGFGFLSGAAIYCFTFIIGNNFDYRLSFLIFTIPMLFLWSKERKSSVIYKSLFFSVLWLMWSAAFRNYTFSLGFDKILFLFEEACSWFIFFGFACLLFKWVLHTKFCINSKVG